MRARVFLQYERLYKINEFGNFFLFEFYPRTVKVFYQLFLYLDDRALCYMRKGWWKVSDRVWCESGKKCGHDGSIHAEWLACVLHIAFWYSVFDGSNHFEPLVTFQMKAIKFLNCWNITGRRAPNLFHEIINRSDMNLCECVCDVIKPDYMYNGANTFTVSST